MPDLLNLLLWVTAIGCVVVGTGSLAMMTFVTDRLARLERRQAAERMLALVSVGERSLFAIALYASAACCVVVFLIAAPSWIHVFGSDVRDWRSIWAFLGSTGYLLGAFAMMMIVMPHLSAHIRAASDDKQDSALWPLFLRVWRIYFLGPAVFGIGAALAFVAALYAS